MILLYWKDPFFVLGISHTGMPALLKFIKLYTYLLLKVLSCTNTVLLKKVFWFAKFKVKVDKQLFPVYSKKAYFYTQFQWIFLEDSYTTNDIPNFLPIETIKHTLDWYTNNYTQTQILKANQYLQPPEWINISVQYLTSSKSDCYVYLCTHIESYCSTMKCLKQC